MLPYFFYRATACNCNARYFQGLSVRLSVRLFVKRVDCDKTNDTCAHILLPHERSFILVLTRKMVGWGDPLYLKFWV